MDNSSNKMVKFKPLNNLILVNPIKVDSVTVSGIIIPDTAKNKPNKGEVIAVSDCVVDLISVGDIVIYKEYAGNVLSIDGCDYLVIDREDLYGIL